MDDRPHGQHRDRGSQVDSTRNFTVGALAVAKVFVPESLIDDARRVLATPVDAAADQEELRQRGEGENEIDD